VFRGFHEFMKTVKPIPTCLGVSFPLSTWGSITAHGGTIDSKDSRLFLRLRVFCGFHEFMKTVNRTSTGNVMGVAAQPPAP